MRQRVLCWLVLIIPLLMPAGIVAQEPAASVTPSVQRAVQELESIIAEADRLADKLAVVKVRARATNLLWLRDSDRARMMFQELWKWAEEQKDESLDHEAARTEILKNLFPRDPTMARDLLEQISEKHRSEDAPFQAQIAGTDPNLKRLAKLSSELIDQDTAMAATMLERSLSVSVSPAALLSLFRLREKNPNLADYLVAQTLETLRARPTVVALPGVYLLIDYVFPSKQTFAEAIIKAPDPSLRTQYFSAAHAILKRSLTESEQLLLKEQRYTERDIRFRSIYQGQIARVVSALAPRYAPELVEELNKLAVQLTPSGVPPDSAQLSRLTAARIGKDRAESDSPEMAISVAIARGESEKAKRLLDKLENESVKKALSQTIANVEFRTHLAKSNLTEALMAARKIEDLNVRASLYSQIAKAAYKKGEVEFSRLMLAEASAALSESDQNGIRALGLLSLASEASAISVTSSLELLLNAASVINSLKGTSGTEAKADPLARMNDPRSFIDASELQKAFSSVGSVDFDGALLAASQIQNEAVKLIARLAACERLLAKADEQ